MADSRDPDSIGDLGFSSGSRNQIEIEADPCHREILFVQMNMDGANTRPVTNPAMKLQEWAPQMLTRPSMDRVVDIQKCEDESEPHVYQPRGCAACGATTDTTRHAAAQKSTAHTTPPLPVFLQHILT